MGSLPASVSRWILCRPRPRSTEERRRRRGARCCGVKGASGRRRKARLAAERASKAEQEKAAATAKAAEEKRLAAEKTKQVEEAKAAAAEQRRKEAEAAAAKALADKLAAEKALAEKLASDKAAAEAAAKQAAEKQLAINAEQKVAVIAPASTPPAISRQEMTKLVQSELRRVGCLAASADGDWNASSQRSLVLFNKYAGTKLDAKVANFEALDAIKSKPGRVCPLVCDHGFRADGDACVKIACRPGYRVNDVNECERVQDKKPVASRDDQQKRDAVRKQTEAAPSKSQASGQIFCNSSLCRPVAKGCHLEVWSSSGQATGRSAGGGGGAGQREVCD